MRVFRFIGLGVLSLILCNSNSFGQNYLSDPKYGEDEDARKECATNNSIYGEYYKQKNYNDAYPSWKKVLSICPRLSKNTYIRGAKILKFKIDNAQDAQLKMNYLDTLMQLYDTRIEFFNERASVLGIKAQDLFTYAPERFEEAFGYSQEVISTLKENTDIGDIHVYMLLVNTMVQNNKMDAENAIEAYSMVSDYVDKQIAAKADDEKLAKAKESIDAIFAQMGVANCENLIPLFTPRFESNPTDINLCKKIRNLFQANKCTTDPLYLNVSVAIYDAEPSAKLAYEISQLYRGIKNFKDMEKFYDEAIAQEQDSTLKSKYYYELAVLTFSEFKKFPQARTLALKAIEYRPNDGESYRLIGDIYASERNCGSDDFERKSVYWAAVDKYIKAKQVNPALTETMNALISSYSQYFPSKEDLFFHDLKVGDTITVGCWINERTTVRERK